MDFVETPIMIGFAKKNPIMIDSTHLSYMLMESTIVRKSNCRRVAMVTFCRAGDGRADGGALTILCWRRARPHGQSDSSCTILVWEMLCVMVSRLLVALAPSSSLWIPNCTDCIAIRSNANRRGHSRFVQLPRFAHKVTLS